MKAKMFFALLFLFNVLGVDMFAQDEEILKSYGFKTDTLPQLYSILTETINNRVEMKNR